MNTIKPHAVSFAKRNMHFNNINNINKSKFNKPGVILSMDEKSGIILSDYWLSC